MSGLIKVMRRGAKKPVPLFSRVDEAAQELPRTKGTGKEFMAELKKQPGVKKAELEDRKLSSLESAPKMTKEEFVNKLKEKPATKIEETIKANPTDADLDARAMELIEKEAEEMTDDRIGRWDRSNSYEWLDYKEGAVQYLKSLDYDKYLRQAKRDIEENVGGNFPKFQDWKLPGGENYREILLRLPPEKSERDIADANMKAFTDKVTQRLGFKSWDFDNMTPAELVEYEALNNAALKASTQPPKPYKSSHWEEPNVLAHMRVQDRVGPNGEKILHVEEIQSDWHQQGRKEGYGLIDTGEKRIPFDPTGQNQFTEPRPVYRQGVPDAPFKKNWHELATKKLMNYAIENGYDKVAFTPGAEQASRYDLSKHIDAISISPTGEGKYRIDAQIKGGGTKTETNLDASGVEAMIGKELASKLITAADARLESTAAMRAVAKSGDDVEYERLREARKDLPPTMISGLDLQVGGEGMRGFYDKIIPNYLTNEYGKYGASVGTHDIPVPPKNSMDVQEYTLGPEYISGRATWDELLKANPSLAKEYAVPLHSIDITPQMREAIEAKGQPLYQAVGIGLTGAAAAPKEEVHFSDNPDAMMMEMEDKGFAGGGLLKKAAKALKGTQEVLPAAEREANLAKMLESSAIKDRVYHGTSADISKFNPSKIGAMGPGTYVTTNPKTADSYADLSNKSPNVLPLHVQVKNPFPISSVMKSGAEFFTHFDPTGKLSDEQVVELAKKAGYDAVHAVKEGELNIFEPSKIKSAIGNRGTYDVTDPDINKAQGGLTKVKRK